MSSLRLFSENDKLTGPNYVDWLRAIKIALTYERVWSSVTCTPLTRPADDADENLQVAYRKWAADLEIAQVFVLSTLDKQLQRQHESMSVHEIFESLKALFGEQSRSTRYETTKKLFNTKMQKGQKVDDYVLMMKGYIDKLASLDVTISQELQVDLILGSLTPQYEQFILNYNMNNMNVSLVELLNMLRSAESQSKDQSVVLAVKNGTSSSKGSKKRKRVNKKGKKAATTEKGECHHCHKKGHWKRNCPEYLKIVKEKKQNSSVAPTGIFTIQNSFAINKISWVLDTGSGTHICNTLQGLRNKRHVAKGEVEFQVADGSLADATAVGDFHLVLPNGFVLILNNCYYAKDFICGIISVSRLSETGYVFHCSNNVMNVMLDGNKVFDGFLNNGIYMINTNYICAVNNSSNNNINQNYLWHCRLGHISEKRLHKLKTEGFLPSLDSESFDTCESCLKGKMTKHPFSGSSERVNELLGLVHTDVCGPMPIVTKNNSSYFVTFTDDFSRLGYIYLMKNKSDVCEKFKEYKNEVENQTNNKIKILRSDRGGEYVGQELQQYLKDNGIISQVTPPYTPQHNGVSERRNRTLLDMVRSMMSKAELPLSYWGYALETAAHMLNLMPTKSVPKTPYEMWHGKKPHFNYLKVWGCPAYVKNIGPNKLEARSVLCKLLGYPKNSLGYIFYNTEEQKVIVSRHAVFLEKEFLAKEINSEVVELDEIQEVNVETEPVEESNPPVNENTQPIRRSNRESRTPKRYYDLLVDGETEDCVLQEDTPLSFQQALRSKESALWLEAMKNEMDSMYENKVWTLTDIPEGIKPIGCKWIFKKKLNADGKVETYKARLVAKGFRQIQGVDYDETFSPVAMLKSIRIMLALAAFYDYEIWQMDVKTAFLNGDLEETVYMSQPEGFESSGSAGKACKLLKSIYGLKQASRSWNKCFDKVIKQFGFYQNTEEACIYRKEQGKAVTFLVLYVDDLLLIGNDIAMLQSVKAWLSKNFSMKDLGEAAYILGIRIYRDRSKRLLGLSQHLYIDTVLKRFSMENSKRGNVPTQSGIVLSKKDAPHTDEEKERMNRIPYASAIGSIMYAMLCTRPDVAYALGCVSRFQSNPGEKHWTAVKCILKYLRNTQDLFLIYGNGDLLMKGYTDSSFQSDIDDSKSISGYVFTLNGGAVSWKSSKQETVADSTMEAEYIALNEAAKEAVWMRKFLAELGVIPNVENPMTLFCDNNAAMQIAKEPRAHKKSRHIRRKFHLIREFVANNEIMIERVDTKDNIADPFTKGLARSVLNKLIEGMGLRFHNWPQVQVGD